MAWTYTTYATPACAGVPLQQTSSGSSTDVYNEVVFSTKDYFDLYISTSKLLPIQFGALSVQFPNIGFTQKYTYNGLSIGTPKGPEYRSDFDLKYTGQFLFLNSSSYTIPSLPLGVQICFSVTDGWTHPYYSSKPSYVFWS